MICTKGYCLGKNAKEYYVCRIRDDAVNGVAALVRKLSNEEANSYRFDL